MYNKTNAILSESQISKLKNALKNRTGVSLRLSRNMLGTDEEQFPHQLLLTDRQVNKLRSQDSANIKFSKTQITKMSQSGGFLASLMRFAMPLLKNVIAPLGLTAAMSATDAGIQKRIRGSGQKGGQGGKGGQSGGQSGQGGQSGGQMSDISLTISVNDMHDIMQIIQALEEKGIVVPGTTKAVDGEIHAQRGGFLGMLLGTLGASLLGNLLTGSRGSGTSGTSGTSGKGTGKGIFRAGDRYGRGIVRAGADF